MVQRFDNVGIAVRDLVRAIQFYRRLGFEPQYVAADSAMVRAGSAALYLFVTQTGAPQQRSFDLQGNPPGIDHLSFQVADVDAACAALKAEGVVVEREPRDYEWGARAACIRDPDGNCIWLLQR